MWYKDFHHKILSTYVLGAGHGTIYKKDELDIYSDDDLINYLLGRASEKKQNTKRKQVSTGETRYIPQAVRHTVIKRSKNKCEYKSMDGKRCTERVYLHFDHIKPFALGGKSTHHNIRHLCANHNHRQAIKMFGIESRFYEFKPRK